MPREKPEKARENREGCRAMSKLLIAEHPLILLPSLAKEIGLHEAIILQQLHYWITHVGPDGRRYGKVKDDSRWIRNTVSQWQQENFPFLTDNQIYRAFESLESDKLVLSRKDLNSKGFDRTKWYTVNYPILHTREMELALMQNAFRGGRETIPETTSEKKEEEEEATRNIFSLYMNNINPSIAPLMMDELMDYENTHPYKWLEKAFKIAVENNARKWSYIKAILDRWEVEGYGTDNRKKGKANGKHQGRSETTTPEPTDADRELAEQLVAAELAAQS